MKFELGCVIGLMLAVVGNARAGSATWSTHPSNFDWNKAANWSPATIPNGPSDTATFAGSQQPTVMLSHPSEVNSIVFNPGGIMFSINTAAGAPLTISGAGIVNNSGLTQYFSSPAAGSILITNTSSAGNETVFTNSGANGSGGLGGLVQFSGTASAGSATLTNNGTSFTGGASGGTTEFLDDSTAGQGTFVNNGGLAPIAYAGGTIFRANSTAGTGSFSNKEGAIGSFPGFIDFYDNASADHGTFICNGTIVFSNSSTAANGTFTIGGSDGGGVVSFIDTSSAGAANFTLLEDTEVHVSGGATLENATFTANGATESGFGSSVDLSDTTTADHATLIANGGTLDGESGLQGTVGFEEESTAAEATLIVNPGTVRNAIGGTIGFGSGATAGESNITVNGAAVAGSSAEGLLVFDSTAGNATILASGGSNGGRGGMVQFLRDGDGGTCRIQLLGNSQLDLDPRRRSDLTIGSLEGHGSVFLGGHGLVIGSNNLSTVFSGQIYDGRSVSSPPGSLAKIGSGTLELTAPSSYTDGTTVNAGTLVVSNDSGSGTGTGPLAVASGSVGGGGIIAGNVTIGTGSGSGASLAPAAGSNKQITFTIQDALTFNSDATYTCTFKAKLDMAVTDKVVAKGVTIQSGASIALSGQIRGTLEQGLTLTLISNTSASPITGTFANLPDGGVVTLNGNDFQASYEGGDGNDLTLMVVP